MPKNGKIHIVHIVTSLEPGGLENGVVNLARNLDPERFQTSVLCLERKGEFCERLSPRNELICLEKPPGFRPLTSLRIARLLREMKADIVHTHNLGPLLYGTLAKLVSTRRFALVQGEHAQLREDERTPRRRRIRKISYRLCRAVHTVSEGLRRELIEFGLPASLIRVIRNGVDSDRFCPNSDSSRASETLSEDFVIGMVGRFGAFKRHDLLIQAFEVLAGGDPHLRLLIVGDSGPEKERIVQMMEDSPFRDRISWVGFQQDPIPFYRQMNLLVVPSENEGLSNAMLEALSCGVPCLAHPACGAGEIIEEGRNGFLREMRDTKTFAGELATVIEMVKGDTSYSAEARASACENFSLEVMMDGYRRMYEEEAEEGGII
ncbi:MAG: glycosyltransferase [Verrucomicrobiales bacterium]|nr:glycosyltransferase [Verrucomicrobiales bacterium]